MSLLYLFIVTGLLWFGIISLVSGLFASYFGAGRSRKIGFILLTLGTVFIAFVILTQFEGTSVLGFSGVDIGSHLLGMAGAALGGGLGLLLFLYCIMKA